MGLEADSDRWVILGSRDPFSWYVSVWCHRRSHGIEKFDGGFIESVWCPDFAEFVDRVLEARPRGLYRQAVEDMLSGTDPAKVIRLRMNAILADLAAALDRIGVPYDIRRLMAQPPLNMAKLEHLNEAKMTPTIWKKIQEAECREL